jgi:voltage-gated potassium channel
MPGMTSMMDPTRSGRLSDRKLLPVVGMHNAAVWLLAALAGLFVAAPFVEDLHHGPLIEACLFTSVMVFAVLAVGARGRALVTALVLVVPALTARWLHHLRPDLLSPVVFLSAGMLFLGFVAMQIVRFILRTPRVDANVLCAGLSGYLILGLLWVPAYMIINSMDSSAFSFSTTADAGATLDLSRAYYFSYVTLSTVGYGDVVPVSKVARMLATMEAIAGVFYTAVFISRLVAIYSSSTRPPPDAADGPNPDDHEER